MPDILNTEAAYVKATAVSPFADAVITKLSGVVGDQYIYFYSEDGERMGFGLQGGRISFSAMFATNQRVYLRLGGSVIMHLSDGSSVRFEMIIGGSRIGQLFKNWTSTEYAQLACLADKAVTHISAYDKQGNEKIFRYQPSYQYRNEHEGAQLLNIMVQRVWGVVYGRDMNEYNEDGQPVETRIGKDAPITIKVTVPMSGSNLGAGLSWIE